MKWLELTIIVCITDYALGLQASADDIRFLKEKLESLMSAACKFLILTFVLLPTIYIQMIHTNHHLLHVGIGSIIFLNSLCIIHFSSVTFFNVFRYYMLLSLI
jgi:hypothetical protein